MDEDEAVDNDSVPSGAEGGSRATPITEGDDEVENGGEEDERQEAHNAAATSSASAAAPTGKRKKRLIVLNASNCRYDVVREAAKEIGWVIEDEGRAGVSDEFSFAKTATKVQLKWLTNDELRGGYRPEKCQVFWVDMSVLLPRISKLRSYQRINHFPSMRLIARKSFLFVHLMQMKKSYPEHYNFFPISFSLRSEPQLLWQFVKSLKGKPKTFVMKPNAGCEGKGIILTRQPLKVAQKLPSTEDYTVQLYVHRPLLIDNKKFDMRVYVLVLSITDLEILVHNEGLVRICAEEYQKPNEKNLESAHIHLTNYAVNRNSDDYERNDVEGAEGNVGNKRDFCFLEEHVNETLGPGAWVEILRKIDQAVVLTVLSALHELRQELGTALAGKVDSRCCFELLGVDILLNSKGNVFILEVNHSPSLVTDSPLDVRIKKRVVADTFRHLSPFLVDLRRQASDLHYKRLIANAAPLKTSQPPFSNPKTNFRHAFPPYRDSVPYRAEEAAQVYLTVMGGEAAVGGPSFQALVDELGVAVPTAVMTQREDTETDCDQDENGAAAEEGEEIERLATPPAAATATPAAPQCPPPLAQPPPPQVPTHTFPAPLEINNAREKAPPSASSSRSFADKLNAHSTTIPVGRPGIIIGVSAGSRGSNDGVRFGDGGPPKQGAPARMLRKQ